METAYFIIECLGCIAFAFYGAMVAIHNKMDLFGIWISALITTFGGGLLRDIIIGQEPPMLFISTEYYILAGISTVVSMACAVAFYFKKPRNFLVAHENGLLINTVDAVGLAVFCVLGMNSSFAKFSDNAFLLIFIGTITGTGGGMLRDIFMAKIPQLFKKHLYAVPTILGAGLYALLVLAVPMIPQFVSSIIAMLFIIGMRILATVFHLNLPVPGKFEN